MSAEEKRHRFEVYARNAEVGIYGVLAILLTITAAAAICDGAVLLWNGIRSWTKSRRESAKRREGLPLSSKLPTGIEYEQGSLTAMQHLSRSYPMS